MYGMQYNNCGRKERLDKVIKKGGKRKLKVVMVGFLNFILFKEMCAYS
jgi:hypothetical protein